MEITTIIFILIFSYFLAYCTCDTWQCDCGRNYFVTCSNTNCFNTAKQYIGSRGIVTVPLQGDKLTVICNKNTEEYVMPKVVQCNVCADEVFPNIFIPTCVQPSSITATSSTSPTPNKTEELTFSSPRDNSTVQDSSHHQFITKEEIGLIIMAVIIFGFIIAVTALALKRCVCYRNTQVTEELVYDYAMVDFIQTSSKERSRGELDSSPDVQQNLNKRPMLPIPLTNDVEYKEPMDALLEKPYIVPFSAEN